MEGIAGFEQFGRAVSISEDGYIAAVGAPSNNTGGTAAGRVALFTYDTLTNSYNDGTKYDYYASSQLQSLGEQVALSKDGQILAVSAPGFASNTGSIELLLLANDSLTALTSTWSGENVDDNFGSGLALSADGTTLAGGSPGDGNGAVRAISTSYAALPVSWLSFTGSAEKQGIRLSWQVFEQDNYGYYVEHSTNGKSWQTLGFKSGAGSRAASNQYHFFSHCAPSRHKLLPYLAARLIRKYILLSYCCRSRL